MCLYDRTWLWTSGERLRNPLCHSGDVLTAAGPSSEGVEESFLSDVALVFDDLPRRLSHPRSRPVLGDHLLKCRVASNLPSRPPWLISVRGLGSHEVGGARSSIRS
jgi:hypothetical protein